MHSLAKKVQLIPLACGWLRVPRDLFLRGEPGALEVPVPSYLVVHPKGNLLFDTGLDPQLQSAPGEPPKSQWNLSATYHPGQDIHSQLIKLGIDPESVRSIVTSHLHFDHVGGNHLFPNAEIIIQRKEWEAGQSPALQEKVGYLPTQYSWGHALRLIDGEVDLFGDGSVVCVPTHGHTPGHQSLQVRTGALPTLLTADACYLRETFLTGKEPDFCFDREQFGRTLQHIRDFEARGGTLWFGHDPDQWSHLMTLTSTSPVRSSTLTPVSSL